MVRCEMAENPPRVRLAPLTVPSPGPMLAGTPSNGQAFLSLDPAPPDDRKTGRRWAIFAPKVGTWQKMRLLQSQVLS